MGQILTLGGSGSPTDQRLQTLEKNVNAIISWINQSEARHSQESESILALIGSFEAVAQILTEKGFINKDEIDRGRDAFMATVHSLRDHLQPSGEDKPADSEKK